MAKKNTKKLQLSYFKDLNSKNKVIAIVAIALLVSIIGSVIPGDTTVTGMQTKSFEGVFNLVESLLSGANGLIMTIFEKFFPGEDDIKLIYFRVILFIAVASIGYFIMRTINEGKPFINVAAGAALAYASTFFIKKELLEGIGFLYSDTFSTFLLVVPIILLWVVVFKLPKTKAGYLLKALIFFIMGVLVFSNNFETSSAVLSTIFSAMIVVIAAGFIWSWIKFARTSFEEEEEEKAVDSLTGALSAKMNSLLRRSGEEITKKGS